MVSKRQIAFESPANWREFTSIFIKIIECNKRRPMKKRSPAAGGSGMSIYFKEVCDAP